MTHAAALPASMSFDIAGLVTERLEHANRLGESAAGYVAHALAPLVTTDLDATEPAIVVTVVDEVPVPRDGAEYGVRLGPNGTVWIGDHRGRGGLLSVTKGGGTVLLDRNADASVLSRLRVPLLEIALSAAGGGTLRAAGVQVDGLRLGIAGWAGMGKSRIVLELLSRHGGRLLGDDLLAVTREGEIATLSCRVTVRPEHRNLLPRSLRRRARMRQSGARVLGRFSKGRGLPRTAAAFANAGARVMRDYSEQHVGVGQLIGNGRVGSMGRLDAVLILGSERPGVEPSRRLAAYGCSYSAHVAALEAALLAQGLDAPLLPDVSFRQQIARRALSGAHVIHGRADGPSEAAAAVAALLAAARDRQVVDP
ncbi:MAG: hypothetical protein WD532_06630 [Acidimicrobiia bacterium]